MDHPLLALDTESKEEALRLIREALGDSCEIVDYRGKPWNRQEGSPCAVAVVGPSLFGRRECLAAATDLQDLCRMVWRLYVNDASDYAPNIKDSKWPTKTCTSSSAAKGTQQPLLFGGTDRKKRRTQSR